MRGRVEENMVDCRLVRERCQGFRVVDVAVDLLLEELEESVALSTTVATWIQGARIATIKSGDVPAAC